MPSGINTFTPPQWCKWDNTEKLIGTWFDTNYMVYERTFSVTVPSTQVNYPNTTWKCRKLMTGISGVNFIDITGKINWVNGSDYGVVMFPWHNGDNNNTATIVYCPTDGALYGFIFGSHFNNQTAELTCWYYK